MFPFQYPAQSLKCWVNTPDKIYDLYYNGQRMIQFSRDCTYDQQSAGGLLIGFGLFFIGLTLTFWTASRPEEYDRVMTTVAGIVVSALGSLIITFLSAVWFPVLCVLGVIGLCVGWYFVVSLTHSKRFKVLLEGIWNWISIQRRVESALRKREKKVAEKEKDLARAEAKLDEIRKVNPEFAAWEETLSK